MGSISPSLLSSIRSRCTGYPRSPWEAGHRVGSGERKPPPPSRRLLGFLGGGDGCGQGTFCFRTDSRVCAAGSYAVRAGRGGRGSILPWAQPRPAPEAGARGPAGTCAGKGPKPTHGGCPWTGRLGEGRCCPPGAGPEGIWARPHPKSASTHRRAPSCGAGGQHIGKSGENDIK